MLKLCETCTGRCRALDLTCLLNARKACTMSFCYLVFSGMTLCGTAEIKSHDCSCF